MEGTPRKGSIGNQLEALGSTRKHQEALGRANSTWKHYEALGRTRKLLETLESTGKHQEALGSPFEVMEAPGSTWYYLEGTLRRGTTGKH